MGRSLNGHELRGQPHEAQHARRGHGEGFRNPPNRQAVAVRDDGRTMVRALFALVRSSQGQGYRTLSHPCQKARAGGGGMRTSPGQFRRYEELILCQLNPLFNTYFQCTFERLSVVLHNINYIRYCVDTKMERTAPPSSRDAKGGSGGPNHPVN